MRTSDEVREYVDLQRIFLAQNLLSKKMALTATRTFAFKWKTMEIFEGFCLKSYISQEDVSGNSWRSVLWFLTRAAQKPKRQRDRGDLSRQCAAWVSYCQ